MKYLIVICLSMSFIAAHGQDTKPCPCNNELTESFEPNLKGKVYLGLVSIVGTEFYTPSFVKGDIFLENGETAVDHQIRYNGRVNGLVLLTNGRQILLDNYFIQGFCLKDVMGLPKICFRKIKMVKEFSNDSIQIFAQILYQNKLSLYAFRRYGDKGEVIKHVGKTQVSKRSFGPSFVYYFQLPNHKTIGFKKFKRKDLYELFPERKEVMKQLFRENHQRRFKNESDLVRITEILNKMID
jgi:hypothetical protein